MPTTSIADFENILSQIGVELALCQEADVEGIVPLYTLFSQLLECVADEPAMQAACGKVLARLGSMLDNGESWSNDVLAEIGLLVESLQTADRYWQMELPLPDDLFGAPVGSVVKSSKQVEAADSASPSISVGGAIANTGIEQSPATQSAPAPAPLVFDVAEKGELYEEFFNEASEHLEMVEAALLDIEQGSNATEAISTIFRCFHTIKGVAGFLDIGPMQRLAHEVETLLDHIRAGRLKFSPARIQLVLEARDRLNIMLGQMQDVLQTGQQPTLAVPVDDLVARTVKLCVDSALPSKSADAQTVAAQEDSLSQEPERGASPAVEEEVDSTSEMVAVAGGQSSARTSIRVSLDKLDSIIDGVGELVIVESQLRDSLNRTGALDPRVERNLAQLNRITRELRFSGLSLRMIALRPTFQKMHRLVRDLAEKCQKKVHFEVHGEETEVDRRVVEEIGDPLVHMIRNSLDHGIESREDRVKVGKPEVGTLQLRAFYSGDNIIIELEDDGAGIPTDKVLRKAIDRGLASADKEYSNDEIFQFIFLPGFSTAAQISDVSGRGVGMDVVRTNIQKLGGRISMESTLGKGTLIRIALPLTLAILDGLLIRSGTERYILPVLTVRTTLCPNVKDLVTVQGKGRMIRDRESLFRVFDLSQYYQTGGVGLAAEKLVVVMVETKGDCFGILIDEVLGKHEVVVKQLAGISEYPPGVSGGAILGNGEVALILDPGQLSNHA